MTDRVRVLYIAGWGRSGSTILDTALGQVDGLVSVGEVKFIWERGLMQNGRCSCGRRLRECPFWLEAFSAAYRGMPSEEVVAEMNAHAQRFRTRHLPILLTPGLSDWFIGRSSTYLEQTVNLYRGILNAGGGDVVVDSSKYPSYLAMLNAAQGIRVDTVHLVRDPRAVAYSWMRVKVDPDNPDKEMPRLHPASTAAYWTVWNSAIERIGQGTDSYMRIRYEDVVASPRSALESILDSVGLRGKSLPFTDDRSVMLETVHTVSGNPIRFQKGEVAIRGDSAWFSEMSPSDRRWAEIMSAPLRGRYGY